MSIRHTDLTGLLYPRMAQIDIIGGKIPLKNWSNFSRRVTQFAFDEGAVDLEQIEIIVKNVIILKAEERIFWHNQNGECLDHPLCKPDCIAYALKEEHLNETHLAKMSFDHRETPEQYIESQYVDGMLESLVNQLMTETDENPGTQSKPSSNDSLVHKPSNEGYGYN